MAPEPSVHDIRAQFPALVDPRYPGRIYMDNAGGSQVLQSVVSRMTDYLLNTNVQLGASYNVGVASTERVNQGLEAVREFLNATSIQEIFMGSSTTQLMRNLSIALGPTLGPDDEIILTNSDHEANIGAFATVAKSRGCTLHFWNVNPQTLQLELDDLRALLNPKTRFVAMTHCSNILGTINPIKQVADMVHEVGAELCVDGVAYAPHRRVDVRDLDVDYYGFSWYKVYGPHVSTLYVRQKSLEKLASLAHYFHPAITHNNVGPGGPNYESTYAITAIVEYIKQLGGGDLDRGYEVIKALETRLADRLYGHLRKIPHLRFIGIDSSDPERRVPTFSFVIPSKSSKAIVEAFEKETKGNIGIRWGNFYSKRLVDDTLSLASIDGVVRVSMVHYNTVEEADRVGEVLSRICQ